LSAEAASGHVTVEFVPSAPGDVTVDAGSISGGVTVVAPSDFAGRVEMSTTSGSVRCDLPLVVQGRMKTKHISGSVGQGTGSLSLRATSGSVHVR
jgi:lia operon protein LiaG